MIKINQLKLTLDQDIDELKILIAKKLKVSENSILNYQIIKESIDARKTPFLVYSCLVEIANENKYLKYNDVFKYEKDDYIYKNVSDKPKVNVVGFGPSGIFCSYVLAKSGVIPVIFERGSKVEERVKDVNEFWNNQILNPNSNVQYGEGGAGTFSDGKLTTRIKDPLINIIFDLLVDMGADPAIKYQANPHIGTDHLQLIVKNIRNHLIHLGAIFHFNTKVDELIIEDNQVLGLKAKDQNYLADSTVLAIGHSATDTLLGLQDQGVYLEPKDFAIGVRVEHPQTLIDKNQYKESYGHPKLPVSSYRISCTTDKSIGIYSFCMCPGGFTIASNSTPNSIVTNGMSNNDRANHLANSALLVQVKKENFYVNNIRDGLNYQRNIEEKAYNISNSYKAPSMNIKDYLNNTLNPLIFKPSYLPDVIPYNINLLFDDFINDALHTALLEFDLKIPGFIEQGIMIAPETRSSSTVRIKRNEYFRSISHKSLYPCGEGAGYSGGIISSALDGIRVAEAILMSKFTESS